MARGTTSSITARFLVDLLDAAGVAVDDLLEQAGMSRPQLGSAEAAMPLEPFDALWARAAACQPDVGLRLIDRFQPGQMHILAHLASRSATVREALAAVEAYMRLTDDHDAISLEVVGPRAIAHYANLSMQSGRRHNPWLVEHILAMACVLLGRACGRALPVLAVSFQAGPQAPLQAYVERFGRMPAFGAEGNTLVFEASALDWPLLSRDDYLRGILERVVQEQLPPPLDALLPQVRAALRRAWTQGSEPTRAGIAAACGLGEEALRRQLAHEGQSFRRLKDDSRRELAQAHFAGPLSNGEIAYLLGFSEPAALQHACRRWFGRPLGEMRRSVDR
jgi:AraC-like DNA-binding protein